MSNSTNIGVYSAWNTYIYNDKTFMQQGIDFLSAPLRIAFGGHRIKLSTSHLDLESYSIHERVKMAVLSIVIFPIGIVAAIAFVAKNISSESTILQFPQPKPFPQSKPYCSETVNQIEKGANISSDCFKAEVIVGPGRSLFFSIKETASVKDLQRAIESCCGLSPLSSPRLIFQGRQLESELLFSHYKFQNKEVFIGAKFGCRVRLIEPSGISVV